MRIFLGDPVCDWWTFSKDKLKKIEGETSKNEPNFLNKERGSLTALVPQDSAKWVEMIPATRAASAISSTAACRKPDDAVEVLHRPSCQPISLHEDTIEGT